MLITDLRQIGNRMLKFRKQRGLTQAEVAELADISDRTYADIERGGTNLRTITLVMICSALNVTPNDILVDDNNHETESVESIIKRIEKCNEREKETALMLLSIYLNSL